MYKPESCGNCRFALDRGKVNDYAECHRHTPFKTTPLTGNAWPYVLPTDWCGEWAARLLKDDRRMKTYEHEE